MIVAELIQLLAEADERRAASMPGSHARADAQRDVERLATEIAVATHGDLEIVVTPPRPDRKA